MIIRTYHDADWDDGVVSYRALERAGYVEMERAVRFRKRIANPR
jgi:hypothetical protein